MAHLGITVSSNADQADGGLRRLIATTDAAERAAMRLGATNDNLGKGYDRLMRQADAASAMLQRIDRMTGVTGGVKRAAADIEAYGAEMDRLRAKYNPLFAASKQYETELDGINRAHRLGAISAEEQAAALAMLDARYEQAAMSANRLGAANSRAFAAHNTNLMFQGMDIAQMALMGQVPIGVGLQQGSQVGPILQQMAQVGGSRAAIAGVGTALASLISPINLATIGIITLGAAGVQAFGSWISEMGPVKRTMEDHEAWLAKILKGYDEIQAEVDAYIEKATKLPANLARLEITEGLDDDIKRLREVQGFIAGFNIRENALVPLPWSNLNDDLQVLRDLKGELDAGHLSAEEFAEAMRLILMNENVDAQVRQLAGGLYDAGQEAAELEARIETGRIALQRFAGEAGRAAQAMATLNGTFAMLDAGAGVNGALQNALDGQVDALAELKGMIPDVRTAQEHAAELLAGAAGPFKAEMQSAYDLFIKNTAIMDARSGAKAAQKPWDQWGTSMSNFQRQIDQQRMEIELFGQTGYAMAQARAEADLFFQAKQAGVDINTQLAGSEQTVADWIKQSSAEYAELTVQMEEMTKAVAYADEVYGMMGNAGMTAVTGLVDALRDGKIEAKEFGHILGDVLLMGGQFLLQQGGQGFTNWLSALDPFGLKPKAPMKLGFQLPGYADGIRNAPAGLAWVGEDGPELMNFRGGEEVINARDSLGVARNFSSSSATSFTWAPQIDARGADAAAVARLEASLARDRQEFEARVIGVIRSGPQGRYKAN